MTNLPSWPARGDVIDHEVHGNGGLADLLEGNGNNIVRRADGVSDMDISLIPEMATMEPMEACFTSTLFNPSNSYSLLTLAADQFVRIVMVTDHYVLVDADGSRCPLCLRRSFPHIHCNQWC